LFLFSGSNGLTNSPVNILDDEELDGINWKTLGEIFEEENISWKV